jgi:diguanylate cyclase
MKRALLIVLGFAVLLAAAVFLYRKTEAINLDTQNDIVRSLRDLKRLDAEWNANVLKARVGIAANYDAVAMTQLEIRALRETLAHNVRPIRDAALDSALKAMEAAFTEKEDTVEQFKSQNAILRNSLRYLPTAADELKDALGALPEMRAGRRSLQSLDDAVDRLVSYILRYNVTPEPEFAERAASAVTEVERRNSGYGTGMQDQLDLLLRHARIVLQQRAIVDEVLVRIGATPTSQAIDALNKTIDDEFRDKLQEKQRYRSYLFAYSGLLLLLLCYAAARLTISYQLIAQGNRRLQAANETLEQRVAERTGELERQSVLLADLATHDALTGLINRRQLMTQLEHALQRAERHDRTVALMFIDLDGFKQVNDTCGHAIGDLALKEVADRIRLHVRKDDAFARLGGDEFVILLGEAGSRDGAVRLAEDVLRELDTLVEIEGYPVRLSASIGISSAQGGRISPEALLSLADHAMYEAKQQGKGCYRFSSSNAVNPAC